jgi:hypothetical protein
MRPPVVRMSPKGGMARIRTNETAENVNWQAGPRLCEARCEYCPKHLENTALTDPPALHASAIKSCAVDIVIFPVFASLFGDFKFIMASSAP